MDKSLICYDDASKRTDPYGELKIFAGSAGSKLGETITNPFTGKPTTWPLRYSFVSWSASLEGLVPGHYEVRARAVDLNNFAQPEPRPIQKTGRNAIQMHRFEVV